MKSPKLRARVLALVAGAALLGGGIAAVVHALPPLSYTKTYFFDAGMTQYAGERTLYCDGSRFNDGVVTSYVVNYYEPCGVCNPNWENCVPGP